MESGLAPTPTPINEAHDTQQQLHVNDLASLHQIESGLESTPINEEQDTQVLRQADDLASLHQMESRLAQTSINEAHHTQTQLLQVDNLAALFTLNAVEIPWDDAYKGMTYTDMKNKEIRTVEQSNWKKITHKQKYQVCSDYYAKTHIQTMSDIGNEIDTLNDLMAIYNTEKNKKILQSLKTQLDTTTTERAKAHTEYTAALTTRLRQTKAKQVRDNQAFDIADTTYKSKNDEVVQLYALVQPTYNTLKTIIDMVEIQSTPTITLLKKFVVLLQIRGQIIDRNTEDTLISEKPKFQATKTIYRDMLKAQTSSRQQVQYYAEALNNYLLTIQRDVKTTDLTDQRAQNKDLDIITEIQTAELATTTPNVPAVINPGQLHIQQPALTMHHFTTLQNEFAKLKAEMARYYLDQLDWLKQYHDSLSKLDDETDILLGLDEFSLNPVPIDILRTQEQVVADRTLEMDTAQRFRDNQKKLLLSAYDRFQKFVASNVREITAAISSKLMADPDVTILSSMLVELQSSDLGVATYDHFTKLQKKITDLEIKKKANDLRMKQRRTKASTSNAQHRQPQTQHRQPQTQHRQPQTQHRQPQTQHRQPQTQHRQSQTQHRQSDAQDGSPNPDRDDQNSALYDFQDARPASGISNSFTNAIVDLAQCLLAHVYPPVPATAFHARGPVARYAHADARAELAGVSPDLHALCARVAHIASLAQFPNTNALAALRFGLEIPEHSLLVSRALAPQPEGATYAARSTRAPEHANLAHIRVCLDKSTLHQLRRCALAVVRAQHVSTFTDMASESAQDEIDRQNFMSI
jgi:hypothetical protein